MLQGRLLKPQAQMPAPPDELEAQQDTADEERKVSAETDEGSTSGQLCKPEHQANSYVTHIILHDSEVTITAS